MAGKYLLRKACRPVDSKAGCACISPGERDLNGEMAPGAIRVGVAAMAKSAAARNDIAPYISAIDFVVIAEMNSAPARARRSGAAGTAAASEGCCVMGWKPAGQRRLAGSVRSMRARPDVLRVKLLDEII